MNKSVMKCCICNNENIGQFITINNKKYHLCCIEQLQQENKKLNGAIQTYDILLKSNVEENKELKEQLLVTKTNEETFRLEMEDITRILGLDEDTIFDDVKTYARSLKENKILRENAEHNDKVVDKVNWENMLLKRENKQLKDNWNKLRKYFNERIEVCDNRLSTPFCNFEKATKERLIFSQCLEKLEELEKESDNQ